MCQWHSIGWTLFPLMSYYCLMCFLSYVESDCLLSVLANVISIINSIVISLAPACELHFAFSYLYGLSLFTLGESKAICVSYLLIQIWLNEIINLRSLRTPVRCHMASWMHINGHLCDNETFLHISRWIIGHSFHYSQFFAQNSPNIKSKQIYWAWVRD